MYAEYLLTIAAVPQCRLVSSGGEVYAEYLLTIAAVSQLGW